MTDWEKLKREFTLMDWVNVQSAFRLSPEREAWVREIMKPLIEAEEKRIQAEELELAMKT